MHVDRDLVKMLYTASFHWGLTRCCVAVGLPVCFSQKQMLSGGPGVNARGQLSVYSYLDAALWRLN